MTEGPGGDVRTEVFDLSSQQVRLWRHHQDAAGPFHARAVMRIEGALDTELLSGAIGRVVAGHEVLRTGFVPLGDGRVGQRVTPELPLEVVVKNATGGEEADVIARLRAEGVDEDVTLGETPFLRASVLQLADDKHLLVIDMAAMCCDERGLRLLMREIAVGYGSQGALGGAEDEPLQYADFAIWQQEAKDEDLGEAGRRFWSGRPALRVGPDHLGFLDRRRPLLFRPGAYHTRIEPPAAKALAGIAETTGLQQADLLVSCFVSLQSRVTGVADTLVGLRCSGRGYEELGDAIGLMDSYLPLPITIEQSRPVTELAARIAEQRASLEEFQPFFAWDLLNGVSDHGGVPYLPVLVDIDESWPGLRSGSTHFEEAGVYACLEPSALRLSLALRPDAVDVSVYYDTSVHNEGEAAILAERFAATVESLIENPGATVEELEVLGPDERRRLLVEWNDTEREFPRHETLHGLFEEFARQTPEHPALAWGGEFLTYGDLEARANQLAHHLTSLGVGPGVFVALCVDRSIDMIVGILGILKAGGAYVPFDPQYPRDRLSFMLDDTAAPVLVTHSALLDVFPAHDASVVLLDAADTALGELSADSPPGSVTPDDLAYLIFTSGSTGTPKGVMVTHRNAVHSTTARSTVYEDPVERFLLLPSFAFDSSVAGIFGSLCRGGTLVLPGPDAAQDPRRIIDVISRHRVTHVLLLPTLYEAVLSQAQPPELASLQCVCVAGEACPARLTVRHFEALPETDLYNEYGPTEGSVWSTVHHVTAPTTVGRVPIGRPIANVRTYVLDERRRPVPIGVPGELYLSGAGIARGYLNRPEQTAERFIADPFSSGERLYKTGDLVSYRDDGSLDFLGRVDNQVKVRGYRIELGEIESALKSHADIREAAVVARSDTVEASDGVAEGGGLRLIAYLIPADGRASAESLSTSSLREFLQERLPHYMVPALFVEMEEFPLLPNGKLDRGALPAPSGARPTDVGSFVSPRTATETILADIWADVLQVEQVGVNDNFFELGGDSILSIQTVALASREGLRLTPVMVFEHQTVAELAAAADQSRTTRDQPLFFGLGDRRLYGVYHPPGTSPRRRGAVIFNAIGREYYRAHRPIRALARRLAEEGVHALRFDYLGTGDSAGELHELTPADWISCGEAAVDHLKQVSGLDRVTLIGLRGGAAVATSVAGRRRDVSSVVLWDPVREPDQYVTALVIDAFYPEAFGEALAELDWLPAAGLGIPVLAVATSEMSPDTMGESVTSRLRPGPKAWVENNEFGSGGVPVDAIREIALWTVQQ